MQISFCILPQPGSIPHRALQSAVRSQKPKHPRRRLCPWVAVVAVACQTRVTQLLRAWQRVRTQDWLAPHLTPSPHPQMEVCLWIKVVEVEERDCGDQCERIPATVMRDAPPGDQDTGKEDVTENSMEMSGRKGG